MHRNPSPNGPEWIGGHAPAFEPTAEMRRQVMAMTGFGIVQSEIARWLDIDNKTLRKYFRRELDTGVTEANTRVASALYTNATKHMSVAAQTFWLKSRAGWKDNRGEQDTLQSLTFLHLVAARAASDYINGTPVADIVVDETIDASAEPPDLMQPATE